MAGSVAPLVGAYAFVVKPAWPSGWFVLRSLVVAGLVTALLAMALHAAGFPTDIPRWMYAVATLPFLGPSAAAVCWSRITPSRRAVGVASIPIGLVAALLIVNQHYLYWPTTAELLGRDRTDPLVAPGDVLAMTRGGSRVGASPTNLANAQSLAGPHEHGYLVDLAIPGTSSGFRGRRARIWLPPAFAVNPTKSRPVVIVIGGTPSWPSDWTRAGRLDRAASSVAGQHGGEAPIFVMVDANGTAFADTECVDAPRRRVETYLHTDVPAFITTHFAVDQSTRWGLIGYSEGGTCAVMLALRHPDRFSTFVDLAGDLRPNIGSPAHTLRSLFGGSQTAMTDHDPLDLLASRSFPDLSGWFDVGHGDDGSKKASHTLADAARSSDVTVVEHQTRGGHDYGFVQRALGDALPWLTDRLMKTSSGLSAPGNPPSS